MMLLVDLNQTLIFTPQFTLEYCTAVCCNLFKEIKRLYFNYAKSTYKQHDESPMKQHSGIIRSFTNRSYCFMQFLLNSICGFSHKTAYDYICVHVYTSCRLMRKSLKNRIMTTYVCMFILLAALYICHFSLPAL